MKSFTSVKLKALWTEKRGVVATKRTRKSNLTPHQIRIYHAQFVNINTFLSFCDAMTLCSCSKSTLRLTNI